MSWHIAYLHWKRVRKKNIVTSKATIVARSNTAYLYGLPLRDTSRQIRASMDNFVRLVDRSNTSCEARLACKAGV